MHSKKIYKYKKILKHGLCLLRHVNQCLFQRLYYLQCRIIHLSVSDKTVVVSNRLIRRAKLHHQYLSLIDSYSYTALILTIQNLQLIKHFHLLQVNHEIRITKTRHKLTICEVSTPSFGLSQWEIITTRKSGKQKYNKNKH